MIPSHGNPQMMWNLFGGYLFKCCSVKYQNFSPRIWEDIPINIFSPKNYLKSFPDVSKSHKTSTCPFELTSGSFLIGRIGNLVIPRNRLGHLGAKDASVLMFCLEDVLVRTRPQCKQTWRYNFCRCAHASSARTSHEKTDPGWSSRAPQNNRQKQ